MAETQVKGQNIGDKSVTHLDLDLSDAPFKASLAGTDQLILVDPSDGLLKYTTATNLETFLDNRYYIESEINAFFAGSVSINGYNKNNWDAAYSHSQSSHAFEPLISKSLGYAVWTGVNWLFRNEIYALSTHNHDTLYDNFVSFDVKAESGTAVQIYKSGSSSNTYKGLNFVAQALSGITISGASGGDGFHQIRIGYEGASYSHPTYTVFNPTLTGATVLNTLTTNSIGSVTACTTRTLTLANLGYTGAANADNYGGFNLSAYNGSSWASLNIASQKTINFSGSNGIILDTQYWDVTNYRINFSGQNLLQLSGGTMTGLLTLSAAPSSNLHAATKLYVDDRAGTYKWVTSQYSTGQLLADVVQLQVSLAAATTYFFTCVLKTNAGANTQGSSYGMYYTGTASLFQAVTEGQYTQFANRSMINDSLNTLVGDWMMTASNNGFIRMSGRITTSTAGTFSPKFYKTGTGTTTVNLGSWIKIEKIS
jgi:hypothetical protein